jgi:hypothetical protein
MESKGVAAAWVAQHTMTRTARRPTVSVRTFRMDGTVQKPGTMALIWINDHAQRRVRV